MMVFLVSYFNSKQTLAVLERAEHGPIGREGGAVADVAVFAVLVGAKHGHAVLNRAGAQQCAPVEQLVCAAHQPAGTNRVCAPRAFCPAASAGKRSS